MGNTRGWRLQRSGTWANMTELRLEPTTAVDVEGLLTARQVGEILGLRQKRVYELDIPVVRISARTLRWRRRDVDAWIESRRCTS